MTYRTAHAIADRVWSVLNKLGESERCCTSLCSRDCNRRHGVRQEQTMENAVLFGGFFLLLTLGWNPIGGVLDVPWLVRHLSPTVYGCKRLGDLRFSPCRRGNGDDGCSDSRLGGRTRQSGRTYPGHSVNEYVVGAASGTAVPAYLQTRSRRSASLGSCPAGTGPYSIRVTSRTKPAIETDGFRNSTARLLRLIPEHDCCTGRGVRIPRPERRWQVDHDQSADGLHQTNLGDSARSRPRPEERCRRLSSARWYLSRPFRDLRVADRAAASRTGD